MGILKLIIAALIIGSIAVIINEVMQRNKKAKIAKTLNEELDTVNEELLKADVEGDVLNARATLKARRAVLDQQIVDLANGVIPAPTDIKEGKVKKGGQNDTPTTDRPKPPKGRKIKEGEQPSKPAALKKKASKR